MSAFTARVWPMDRAPKRIDLLGDKARPESAQHIITFPGGAIELTRTTDGSYWAHILVHTGDAQSWMDTNTMTSASGEVVDSRVDTGSELREMADASAIRQIAVLVRPKVPA